MMKLKGTAKNSFEQFVILSLSEGSGQLTTIFAKKLTMFIPHDPSLEAQDDSESESKRIFLEVPSNEMGLTKSPIKPGAALLERGLFGFHFSRIDLDELFGLRLGDFADGLRATFEHGVRNTLRIQANGLA